MTRTSSGLHRESEVGNLLSLMLQIGQFAGGGDTQSSGFIAAYDLPTGKFDGLLEERSA